MQGQHREGWGGGRRGRRRGFGKKSYKNITCLRLRSGRVYRRQERFANCSVRWYSACLSLSLQHYACRRQWKKINQRWVALPNVTNGFHWLSMCSTNKISSLSYLMVLHMCLQLVSSHSIISNVTINLADGAKESPALASRLHIQHFRSQSAPTTIC